ncbi:MAG: HTH domain-containing protein, partial [Anaerovoracaceae bacterium]
TPYPKNPLLAKFFVNIGYADALGSGVRNLYKFTKIYSGGEPDFEEGDVFRLTVPLQNRKNGNLTERQNRIMSMIFDDQSKQVEDIADSLNISRSTVLREVQEIKKQVDIVYIKKTKEWKLPQ